MTDDEYWNSFNPKNWDRGVWLSGVMCAVMIFVSYIAINIFY